MIGGRRPLLPEILDQTDRVGAKSPIVNLFSPVARVSNHLWSRSLSIRHQVVKSQEL